MRKRREEVQNLRKITNAREIRDLLDDKRNRIIEKILEKWNKPVNGAMRKVDDMYAAKMKSKFKSKSIEEKKAIKKILVPLKSNNLTFETKGFIKDLGGNETFFNKINPRHSSRLVKKNDKFFVEIIFELYGKLKKLKRTVLSDDDKNQYIISFKGEIEDNEKVENAKGNLEFTDFDFQVVVQKFIKSESNKNY